MNSSLYLLEGAPDPFSGIMGVGRGLSDKAYVRRSRQEQRQQYGPMGPTLCKFVFDLCSDMTLEQYEMMSGRKNQLDTTFSAANTFFMRNYPERLPQGCWEKSGYSSTMNFNELKNTVKNDLRELLPDFVGVHNEALMAAWAITFKPLLAPQLGKSLFAPWKRAMLPEK